jgi:Protein kinase domain
VEDVRNAVGRYELLRELGRGGMATVYLARQVDLNRLVALKELAALRRSDPAFAHRFLREARLAGSVNNPNVLTVHDLFEHERTPYIAMEYAERGSLRPYLGRMSLSQVGGVLEAVLGGLAAAEQQGIVHRDLKPENLLVTGSGAVKIADFGIAKATNRVQTEFALTSQGATVGTPNYMAPEQALGQELGPWSDLYSLGIIAFEFFIGLPPFADTEEPMAVLMRQVNEEIPPVGQLDPGIDSRLAGWIDRLVAKEPAARPQSAGEAWDELEDILITLLGPRWRREAPLPLLAALPPTIPGPATPPPPGAPQGPLTEAHLGGLAALPTVPNEDARLDATVPPPAAVAPPAEKPRRRGAWRRLVYVLVAVVALAAATLARTGGSPEQPPAASTPTGRSGQSAAVGGLQEIQDRGPQGTNLAAQATSARELAKRYDRAADQVARLESAKAQGSPGARLVVALRHTAEAYRRAATAAAAGDVAGYTVVLGEVAVAKKAVNKALVEMGGTVPQSPQAPGSPDPVDPAGPCGGDSSSDDPSDESCEA